MVFSAGYQSIFHNARRGGCRKKSRNPRRNAVLCHYLLKKSHLSRLVVVLRALRRLTISMTSKLDILVLHVILIINAKLIRQ